MQILSMTPGHVAEAAELVATRQGRLKGIVAAPACEFEEPSLCEGLLTELLTTGQGYVAMSPAGIEGFMLGRHRNGFGWTPLVGHALRDPKADATRLYGALFTAIAERWLSEGVVIHDVELAAEPVMEQAWFDLGFGRRTCLGSAQTAGASATADSGRVHIRQVDESELDEIARLAMYEVDFRSKGPNFAQPMGTTLDDVRAHHRKMFAIGGVHFLARVDGVNVGLLTLEPESPSPLLNGRNLPFVGATSVDPSVRGGGIGRALVKHAFRWCEDNGHAWIGVSFNTANTLSRPFWVGSGFRPSGWKVARRLPPGLAATG